MTIRNFDHELDLSDRYVPTLTVRFNTDILAEFGDADENTGAITQRINESLVNDMQDDMSDFNDANPFGSDPYSRTWKNVEVDTVVTCMFASYIDDETGEEVEPDLSLPCEIADRFERALDEMIAAGKLAYPLA